MMGASIPPGSDAVSDLLAILADPARLAAKAKELLELQASVKAAKDELDIREHALRNDEAAAAALKLELIDRAAKVEADAGIAAKALEDSRRIAAEAKALADRCAASKAAAEKDYAERVSALDLRESLLLSKEDDVRKATENNNNLASRLAQAASLFSAGYDVLRS